MILKGKGQNKKSFAIHWARQCRAPTQSIIHSVVVGARYHRALI